MTAVLPADWYPQALTVARGLRQGIVVTFSDDTISFRRGRRVIRIARHDFPYTIDMITYFDVYHGTVEADAAGVVDYSRPRIHRYRKSGLEFSLPALAEEEEALEGYFRWYTPKPGDLVFDVGAHAGVSTHLLSQAVGPTGRVWAFEPDPIALEHLRLNVARHELANVTIVPAAIAGEAGRVAFQAEGSLGSALEQVAQRPGTRETVDVEAITLADACELAAAAPAYVKMDIEGSEIAVIGSSTELLRAERIHFSIDTNHWVDTGLTNERVEQLFERAGYEAESSAEYGFMTTWARSRGER